MSSHYFLDTNIIVYSFDQQSPHKRDRAQSLIMTALEKHSGLISFQVVQEFLNVSSKKFETPLTVADTLVYLKDVLMPLCEVFPSEALYEKTLKLAQKNNYSFYDRLMIAAALEGRCKVLYSEDLQHGQTIENMKIENPFL